MRTIRQVAFATVLTALLMAITAGVARAQSPQGMKLYVFSSGALTIGKHILQNLGSQDTIKVPVGFFAVMHPQGQCAVRHGEQR
jgi:N-acyl homoserine lactone hydrolase